MVLQPVRKTPLVAAAVVVLLLLAGGLVLALPRLGGPRVWPWARAAQAEAPSPRGQEPEAELVPGTPDTLRLPADVARALRIQVEPARPATEPRTLHLSGRLAFDSNRLARVHARFPGEVVEIGQVEDPERPAGRTAFRPVRVGDRVEAGQVLAVVWSKDLGEKKSELVDALSLLKVDEETLARLEKLNQEGAVPEIQLRQARRAVEADRIAVDRAENTLRSWRLTDEELEAIRAEAERLRQRGRRAGGRASNWAKVEVRARLGGTVVEKNLALGDLVDTTTDLFKVADLTTLAVWADAYEEDLAPLLDLPPGNRTWTVHLESDPHARPLQGRIDYIGPIVDPTQHTALVTGRVENPEGRLRAGQFVTVIVDLPPPPDEVVIPATALIEDGRTSVVFVQPDPGRAEYALRHVAVGRRLPEAVMVGSQLTAAQQRRGLQPVRPGELVVRQGAVELKKAMEDLQTEAKPGG
jgi:cobalt-zinc-cadmium efflux system membrane fusion protein